MPLATPQSEGASVETVVRTSRAHAASTWRPRPTPFGVSVDHQYVARAIRHRFDLMIDTVGLDRQHATNWTLARIQNALWEVEHADTIWHTAPDRAIAQGGLSHNVSVPAHR